MNRFKRRVVGRRAAAIRISVGIVASSADRVPSGTVEQTSHFDFVIRLLGMIGPKHWRADVLVFETTKIGSA